MCFGMSRTGGGRHYMTKVVGVSRSDIDDFIAYAFLFPFPSPHLNSSFSIIYSSIILTGLNRYIEDGKERNLTVHTLTTPYVFVCSHREKDERCGYCGPRIAQVFKV